MIKLARTSAYIAEKLLSKLCQEGDIELAKKTLRDLPQEIVINMVHYAVVHGCDEVVRLVVEEDLHLSTCHVKIAASFGNLSALKLLSTRVNLHEPDILGMPPIIVAARNGHASIVDYLLRQGISVNTKDPQNYTALMLASSEGHMDVIECLLQAGCDKEAQDYLGRTALMLACVRSKVDVVDRLLLAGCDVNASDVYGDTVLIKTVTYSVNDCAAIIDRLTVHGADYHRCNSIGETPLMRAVTSMKYEAVNCLIKLGCDVNAQTNSGLTAFKKLLRQHGENSEMAKILLDNGADPNL